MVEFGPHEVRDRAITARDQRIGQSQGDFPLALAQGGLQVVGRLARRHPAGFRRSLPAMERLEGFPGRLVPPRQADQRARVVGIQTQGCLPTHPRFHGPRLGMVAFRKSREHPHLPGLPLGIKKQRDRKKHSRDNKPRRHESRQAPPLGEMRRMHPLAKMVAENLGLHPRNLPAARKSEQSPREGNL